MYANQPPAIQGVPSLKAEAGKLFSFSPIARDLDGDTLTFAISNKPNWLNFDAATGKLSGTPSAANVGLTPSAYVISVSDGKGGMAKLPAYYLKVQAAANAAPVISGIPMLKVNVGETFSFTPIASDPDNDPLTFTILNKPSWASFNPQTGALTGTPSAANAGTTTGYVISVSDGKGGSSTLAAFNIAVAEAKPQPLQPPCVSAIVAGQQFTCQIANSLGKPATFSLNNQPLGMVIQGKSGMIHWTPTSNQLGNYSVTATLSSATGSMQQTFPITVSAGTADLPGLYIAANGNDKNPGSASLPLLTMKRALTLVKPGDTIYFRGGEYRNEGYGTPYSSRTTTNFARITVSGTESQPITLRPYGNEYVKIKTDANGIQVVGANFWHIDGLELEGNAMNLNLNKSKQLWWEDDNTEINGRGIGNNTSQHINVSNCVIHDFPSAGISDNGVDFITVENNIIYNNGWWTTGGVHGFANTLLTTTDLATANQEKLIMKGNLVFANQSMVISHVFSKGRVDLTIDEGNGLHAQNDLKTFLGKARVENNLMLYNGKGGFGINRMDDVLVKNNSFYQNARVVDTGELVIQTATTTGVINNIFSPRTERLTAKDSSDSFANFSNNVTTGATADPVIPGVTVAGSVFQDPARLNFLPATGIASSMGVPAVDLQRMFAKVKEYGVEVKSPTQVVDAAYLADLKSFIFANWPLAKSSIILQDKATGFNYTYQQRCYYPNAPQVTPCSN